MFISRSTQILSRGNLPYPFLLADIFFLPQLRELTTMISISAMTEKTEDRLTKGSRGTGLKRRRQYQHSPPACLGLCRFSVQGSSLATVTVTAKKGLVDHHYGHFRQYSKTIPSIKELKMMGSQGVHSQDIDSFDTESDSSQDGIYFFSCYHRPLSGAGGGEGTAMKGLIAEAGWKWHLNPPEHARQYVYNRMNLAKARYVF